MLSEIAESELGVLFCFCFFYSFARVFGWQSMVKGLEKSRDQSEGDSEYTDAIAAQVILK